MGTSSERVRQLQQQLDEAKAAEEAEARRTEQQKREAEASAMDRSLMLTDATGRKANVAVYDTRKGITNDDEFKASFEALGIDPKDSSAWNLEQREYLSKEQARAYREAHDKRLAIHGDGRGDPSNPEKSTHCTSDGSIKGTLNCKCAQCAGKVASADRTGELTGYDWRRAAGVPSQSTMGSAAAGVHRE